MRKLIFLLGFFIWQSALSQRVYRYITLHDSLTRPNNTTAYTSGDVINDASQRFLVFSLPRTIANFEILQGQVLADTSAGTAIGYYLNLVKDTTGISSIADNAALTYSFRSGNASRYITSLRGLGAITVAGNRSATLLSTTNAINLVAPSSSFFVSGYDKSKIFGYLEAANAGQPKALGVYDVYITIRYEE